MVKAIWAVACPAGLAGLVILALGGCGSTPVKAASGPGITSGSDAASTAAPSTDASTGSGPQYRIGPEDILHVSVWDNKELTLDVVVRPDGKISMPLVQDVQAEGLTAVDLSALLRQKLTTYIRDPQVSVIVTQVNAPKIFVLGNVAKPGPYPLRSEMSILQALSLAGGFTPFASTKKIKVVHNDKGTQEVRTVNYNDMIAGGEGNYLLKPGDTIVVP